MFHQNLLVGEWMFDSVFNHWDPGGILEFVAYIEEKWDESNTYFWKIFMDLGIWLFMIL